jgi:cold shock protein
MAIYCPFQSVCYFPTKVLHATCRHLAGLLGRFASHCGRTFQNLSKFEQTGSAGKSRDCSHVHTVKRKDTVMTNGTVKFYNGQKGFGFIQPDDGGKDVFVHATALERAGISTLQEGQKVSFDTQTDARSGKIAVGRLAVA